MAKYYNKTRNIISAQLRSGTSAVFASKKWTHVPRTEEGSASLQRMVRKGDLIRREDPKPAPKPVVAPEPELPPTPVTKVHAPKAAAPAPIVVPEPEEAPVIKARAAKAAVPAPVAVEEVAEEEQD